MFSSILILCIGNICRSPLAEVQLKFLLKNTDIKIASAGLHAMHNYPASDHSQTIAQAAGLDLSQHKAQQATQALLKTADLILVMTERQLKEVHQDFPQTRGKVFLVHKMPPTDIPDPYQQEKAAFDYAWTLIQAGLDQWAEIIREGR